jgi:hypothetical protein
LYRYTKEFDGEFQLDDGIKVVGFETRRLSSHR